MTPEERRFAVGFLQRATANYAQQLPFPSSQTLFNAAELVLDLNERVEMADVHNTALNDAYQTLRADVHDLTGDVADVQRSNTENLRDVRELRQLVLDQAGQILELTARLVLLETSDVWPGMPVECREHRCDYYNGYLAQGPAELVHEGYHAAERQYQHRIAQWEQHMDTCQHCKTHFGDCPVAKRMQDGLHEWEKRLRA